ncbi:VanZ family protein [Jatrophihabitans sp. YIM 134969]
MPYSRSLLVHPERLLVHDFSALPTVLLLAAAGVLLALVLPRRRLLAAATGVALAVAVGLTITPFGGWSNLGFETGALHSIVTNVQPHRSALTGWFRNSDGPANVALFLPAGLFLALLLRRPVLAAVGLAGLSFAIECWQSTLTTRIGSFDDVVANSLGAALGAALAAVVLGVAAAVRSPRARSRPTPDRLSRV